MNKEQQHVKYISDYMLIKKTKSGILLMDTNGFPTHLSDRNTWGWLLQELGRLAYYKI